MTTSIPLTHCDSGYISKSQFPYQPSGTSNNLHSMSFFSVLVHLAEMKVIKWLSTAFCTPRPGIGLHGTYEKGIHISLTLTISSGVALLFLKNKQTGLFRNNWCPINYTQLNDFKSWKMMLWKCCTQYASKFGKLSSSHRTGISFQSQRKAMPKNAQNITQLHSSHTLVE